MHIGTLGWFWPPFPLNCIQFSSIPQPPFHMIFVPSSPAMIGPAILRSYSECPPSFSIDRKAGWNHPLASYPCKWHCEQYVHPRLNEKAITSKEMLQRQDLPNGLPVVRLYSGSKPRCWLLTSRPGIMEGAIALRREDQTKLTGLCNAARQHCVAT